MLCICAKKVAALNSRIDALNKNLKFKMAPPAGLPKLAMKAGQAAQAKAAAKAAVAAKAPHPAMQAKAAAAVALSPEVKAAQKLAAAAQFKTAMQAGLGINLTSPTAPCMLNGLAKSLKVSGLLNALGRLGAAGAGNLLPLGELAEGIEGVKDALDVDMLDPKAGEKLKAALAAKAPALELPPGVKLPAELKLPPGALPVLPPPPKIAVSEKLKVDAKLAALDGADDALKAAMGLNLKTPAGVQATAKALNAMGGNMAAAGAASSLLSLAMLGPAMQALAALESVARGLGVDLTQPGGMAKLAAALGPLGSNGAAAAMKSAAGGAAGGAASAKAGAKMGGPAAARAGAKAALKASAPASAAAKAQLAARASALNALKGPLAAMPPVPPGLQMLALLIAQLKLLGIDLVALSPCK